VKSGAVKVAGLPVTIYDNSALTPAEIRAHCQLLQQSEGLDVIFIDHIGLMSPDKSYNTRLDQMTDTTNSLRMLAKDLGCPVVALSQLNRSVENRNNKRPLLQDLRDSGSIEQDAYSVTFVYRDEYYDEFSDNVGVGEIIVAKNRGGRTGTARLYFDGRCLAFRDINLQEVNL